MARLRTNEWTPNNAFLPSLSRGFIKSAAENRGLAYDEVGGISNSLFLRKCKITICILFQLILLKTHIKNFLARAIFECFFSLVDK